MKEHPEYKYRPRRKPKPLIKKDGSPAGVGPSAFAAKFNIPMHFFPPGFDPSASAAFARSFFPPFAAAAAAAAAATGSNQPQPQQPPQSGLEEDDDKRSFDDENDDVSMENEEKDDTDCADNGDKADKGKEDNLVFVFLDRVSFLYVLR